MTGTLWLATDSKAPSGMGEHMLALAAALGSERAVGIAAPAGSALLDRAVAGGHAVKALPGDRQALARWLDGSDAELIHVHAGIGWEGHALALAARDVGVPVVRTEHLPYLVTDPDQQVDHRDGVAVVDRLICVSATVARSHLEAGVPGDRIVTVENGVAPVPPSRPRAALRAEWGVGERPVLLMVGRFSAQKGHALLIEALPAILAAQPGCVVLIAGDGPLLIPTAREIARRGLAGTVRLLGNRQDVPDLMALADLLVLPSSFEGLPLVALEAMAAGLPVVATDVAGSADAIEPGRTGWLAPPNDAPAFGRAVIEALGDPARRATTAAVGRDVHRVRFTAERMVRETAAIYAEVTQGCRERTRMTKTRIGFIGCGGIANRHFGVLEQFDDVEIVALADVDLARATEAAGRFGGRAFDDAAAMLDQVALDALYICVPPFAHGDPERLAIRHGLPFFVEKPVALDLALAEAVADEADAAGLATAVGYHWRYLDTVDEAKALLATNPARLLSGYWLDSTPPPRWWWHDAESGGQMVEQTSHLLDLARYLVGDVASAFGLAGHVERGDFPGLDVATTSTASLCFANGAIANFASTCLLNWNHRVALHIFGEGMAIELTDHDLMVDVGRGRPVRGAEGDPVWREDRDFIDAVQGKENRIRCPYREALATLRLALAVAESARTGQAITLSDTADLREPAHV